MIALCRRVSCFAVGVAIAIPCLVFAGWTFDIEPLKRIIPGLVAMNPLTATNFILCAVSLAVLRRVSAKGETALIAKVAAFIVALAALFKLAGIIFGFDLQLDQLLF